MNMNHYNALLTPLRGGMYALIQKVGPATYTFHDGDRAAIRFEHHRSGELTVSGDVPPLYASCLSRKPEGLTLEDLSFEHLSLLAEDAARRLAHAVEQPEQVSPAVAGARQALTDMRQKALRENSTIIDRLAPQGHTWLGSSPAWAGSDDGSRWERYVTLSGSRLAYQGVIEVLFEPGSTKIASAKLTNSQTKEVLGRYPAVAQDAEQPTDARIAVLNQLLAKHVMFAGHKLGARGPWTKVRTSCWQQDVNILCHTGYSVGGQLTVEFSENSAWVRSILVTLTDSGQTVGNYTE